MTPSIAIVRALSGLACVVAYSLAMHYTSAVNPSPNWAAILVLAPFLGAALLAVWRAPTAGARLAMLAGCGVAGVVLTVFWHRLTEHVGILFYLQHAGIYALLGLMFGRTLGKGQTPLVTQFAALLHPHMSAPHTRYAGQVTIAWTIYFAATAAISTGLFFLADFAAWSLFANVLGTPLTIAMFVLEYAIRCRVLPPEDRGNLAQSWQAWKTYNAKQQAADAARRLTR